MQMFNNLPWYAYVVMAIAVASYAIRYFKIGKKEYNAPDMAEAKFRKSLNSQLNQEQLFALALYTPIAEWWRANTNTVTFLTAKEIQPYLEGWGIDTPDGYWNLTEYFIKDGRRWYFDFIKHIIQTEPKEKWEELMGQKFGNTERANRYLEQLSSSETLHTLKQKGILTFDSEINLGVAGYDAAILAGQARKAFTGNLITEEEAWKVINFAKDLALQHFSSWEDFDYHTYKEEVYHIYKQVLAKPGSPWNTLDWPSG